MELSPVKNDYNIHLDSAAEFKIQSEWWESPENKALCAEIAARVPTGVWVIDAGAGTGVLSRILVERGCQVIAVDASWRAVTALANTGIMAVKADLRRADALGPVDVVVAKHVLKHFGPDWKKILGCLASIATRRLIFTMNVAPDEQDLNPAAPYYDWAVPRETIETALPDGWFMTESFGEEKEPVFVADRTS